MNMVERLPVTRSAKGANETIRAGREALHRRDWSGAESLAARLRIEAPREPAGYQIGGRALLEMKRLEEAAAVIEPALALFPEQAWPLALSATLTDTRGLYAQAIELAKTLRDRFPSDPSGHQFGIAALNKLGRIDEALTIANDAVIRFPDRMWALRAQAQAAENHGDFESAAEIAATLRQRFPDETAGYRIAGRTLLRLGRFAEAEQILRQAAVLFPDRSWPAQDAAAVVDYPRAVRFAEALSGLPWRDFLPAPSAPRPQLPVKPAQRPLVVVLGMHRGGTSLCMKIVQSCGVELGDRLMPPTIYNLGGYQEHVPIVECHERLLASTNYVWSTSILQRPRSPEFWSWDTTSAIERQLTQIVSEQSDRSAGCWGFKDPRTIHFLPLWKDVFVRAGIDPIWILAVRDPRAVAASLQRRDGLPPVLGELLWAEHYLSALRFVGSEIAAIVSYERWFTDPLAQLRELERAVCRAVTPPANTVETALACIRAELNASPSVEGGYAHPLAEIVHSWIVEEPHDLPRLQLKADQLWHVAVAKSRSLVDRPER
jgi:tetratricopeptide (TPR) repeat protein